MKNIKYIFEQTIVITFGILTAMTAEGVGFYLVGDEITFSWFHLLSIIVAAFLCSIPGLLLLGIDAEKMSRGKIVQKLAMHFLLVYAITAGMGYIFRWYTKFYGFVLVSVAFVLVYIFAWVSITWLSRKDARDINSALDSIRDEE